MQETNILCVRCLKNFPFNVNQKVNILMVPDTERFKHEINIDIIHINKSNDYVDLKRCVC